MSVRKLFEAPATLDAPSPQQEGPLIEKVSLERARWFDRNILPHEASLCSWLRRRRLEPHEIDDVVQEAYSILASREKLDDLLLPKAYLFRIAHSLVVRDARRARIVPFEPIENVEELDEAVDPFSPERITIAREELRRLAAVIQTMPSRVRTAFVMRRVQGLSQREIAERMDISESTVEKHIAKGLTLVIERFRNSGNDAPESHKEGKLESIRLGSGSRDPSSYQ
jgi:RNA polymerase sigma factor (sigma-70 family)